jgi:integrase
MGVYVRADAKKWFWLWLEPDAHHPGEKLRTSIRADATDPYRRKDNRALAEQLYHVKMAARAQRIVAPEQKPTILFSAFAAWFRTHKLPTRKGREREAGILDKLIAVFGPYPLTAITPKLVQERWITPRRTTPTVIAKGKRTAARTIQAGPATINREVDFLKCMLAAGVPEYFDRSPLYGMKRLPTTTPHRRLLKPEEETRLLAVMAPVDRALFLIAHDALVRLTDVLDVKWSDLDRDTLRIADPKAGGGFTALLSKRTRRALKAVTRGSSPYIFAERRLAATERDRRNRVAKLFRKYCQAAGVPYGRAAGGTTFHWATRRTGATRMLTERVDLGTVQKIGRWKTADVVLGIYHELIDDAHRAAVEAVGREPRGNREREKATNGARAATRGTRPPRRKSQGNQGLVEK